MRQLTTSKSIERFIQSIGKKAEKDVDVFFTGGVTAVLRGWRESTIDIDLTMDPELDSVFRAIPDLKNELKINVEIASPAHFIPELPGWRDRSLFICKEGKVSFFHYDPYSQALSKIERGHQQDLADAKQMLDEGLIEKDELRKLFGRIRPQIYRYPALDEEAFENSLERFLKSH